MIGYDLDGTLADVNFKQAAYTSLATIYRNAKVIRTPDTPFIVITARGHTDPLQRMATLEWLKKNQPNFRGIRYVDGGEQEKIQGKAKVINEMNITDYYDNNPDIVSALRKLTKAKIHKV